jgi:hypothetical protein
MPAVITDEREFLTEEDEKQAVHADKTLTLDQGNPGLVEQTRIFVGAETRRCDMLLDQTSLNEWAILCGGVEITVMVLEMLAHRGFVDIGTVQDTAYRNLVNMRSSATIVLQASVKVREDRVRERVAATKKDEDRSKFVELVSEIYLPWLERVVPRVITLDTTNLSSEEVALRVGAILRMLTTER